MNTHLNNKEALYKDGETFFWVSDAKETHWVMHVVYILVRRAFFFSQLHPSVHLYLQVEKA